MYHSTPGVRPGWVSYLSHYTHYPVIISLDMSLAAAAPLAGYDQYLTITVPVLDPGKHGFAHKEELQIFWEMERAIVGRLEKEAQVVYAGRTSTQGKKHLIFFLYNAQPIDQLMEELQAIYPAYPMDHRMEMDPEWDIYFDLLFPNLEETNSLLNQRMVNRLIRKGLDLQVDYLVDHWIYCKTIQARAALAKVAQGQGFATQVLPSRTGEHHYPFLLRLQKRHKVDLSTIDAITTTLHTWARAHRGDYDGWEVSVDRIVTLDQEISALE